MMNEVHITYPVIRTKKNTGLYVRECHIACGQDLGHVYKK